MNTKHLFITASVIAQMQTAIVARPVLAWIAKLDTSQVK